MTIIVVRHGETRWNKEEIFRGRFDIPLSSRGISQVKSLSEKLEKIKIDKIFSSPLKRAIATAREVAKPHNLEIELEEDLIDINFGVWEGLPLEKVKERFPKEYDVWIKHPEKFKILRGETLTDVRKRVKRFLKKKVFGLENQCILVVSHRVVTKILILFLLGISNRHFWRIKQDVASFTTLEKTNFGWIIKRYNLIPYQEKIKLKDF